VKSENQGGFVRSVTGDLDPHSLGPTNYHEHLFQSSPLLPHDDLDDEELSLQEAGFLRDSGFSAMVDATPLGLGRQPEAVARIADATRMSIIATTGRHREAHYHSDHWLRGLSVEALAERLISDLIVGMPTVDAKDTRSTALTATGQPVRAGILKAGIGYWNISPFERTTLEALGVAHQQTGAPVMIHLEHCSAAHEVLDVLASLQVPEASVALAHADRSLDSGLHASLIRRGAYLGYDGMARMKIHSDEDLLALTHRVIDEVGPSNILLGGDVARRSRYVAYGGMPGLEYLGRSYLPRLRRKVGEAAVLTILTQNPASWLSWTPNKPQNGL
jgi:phosphotriesterase-related protein